MNPFHIIIVGAGPAGLSAAARAAERDRVAGRDRPSYVLLEGSPAPAQTIQRYQKGKHVMSEPGYLDLRSDIAFVAGTREQVLETWSQDLMRLGVNICYGAEVSQISGAKGAFQVRLKHGEVLAAEHVVLAIGMAGNPRKLGVPGEDLPRVQYHLDDPREFRDETILIVGAGDSAIENALGLAAQNDVVIINRGKEFSRAKEANLNAVVTAIADPRQRVSCHYETTIQSVTEGPGETLTVVLQTPTSSLTLSCNRVIARLGGIPPRRFVESIGIAFPNDHSDAIPELSRQYETNVPGVYVVGSLAGAPLIKQAMNQGYDVVEFIQGSDIKPADHPLLTYLFHGLPYGWDADEVLERFRALVPMFQLLNPLVLRELIIDSEIIIAFPEGREAQEAARKVRALQDALRGRASLPRTTRVVREGQPIYEPGEFGTSFFTIVQGEVTLETEGEYASRAQLGRGEFFGEMSLLSGRPRLERAIAGPGCLLVETPRRTMVKLMNSNQELKSGIDWIFGVRELQRSFAPSAPMRSLRDIAARVEVKRFRAGGVIFQEGQTGDCLYLVRSGAVALSRRQGGADRVVAEVRSGQMIGEMALMGDPVRRESATASVAAEVLEIKRREFVELTRRTDAQLEPLQLQASRHVVDNARLQVRPEVGSVVNFLMKEGLGEATDVLVIDENLCIGCDNCEKACAETHGGISRLDREEGASFAKVHIPISCRHCEQPHCMKDCPPNAIRRAPSGEVFINDTCIGCGNCQTNCPYGVIRMEYEAPKKPGLWAWLLLGLGGGPGEVRGYQPTAAAKAKGKKAVKCDACLGQKGGAACVRACPTGAALRIHPKHIVDLVVDRNR
jgi:Fe-S-cluster-containing hydrogenase component 2/thioredoxin reductase/CRP-like cAMP-binding protein